MSVNVLFIIFNKNQETQRVFNKIKGYKPPKLFIAADGPRLEKVGEYEKCIEIRNWVLANIDWECEVHTLFKEQNIGCGRGPSEAISWFFSNVEEGIILEDDCLPNDTFFSFCEELLFKYRDNKNISIISGNNFQREQPFILNADYYYSIFPSTNGWASWRRVWEGYEYKIKSWEKKDINQKKEVLKFLFNEKKYQFWWKRQFDYLVSEKPNDMWDFQFHYHCMNKQQYAIIPSVNLISNIGYGPDATHSSDPNNYFANFPTKELNFPLIHQSEIKRNYEADLFIQTMLFGEVEIVSFWKKTKRFIKKMIRYNTK